MTMLAENPRERIGMNNPPEPTPFEIISKKIDDLYGEASHWLDGATVENEQTAEGIASLLNLLREAAGEADEARKTEAKPFDDGKAEVQARYAPLIADTKAQKGKTVLAIDACKKALGPWLDKKAKAIEEIARLAREEADRKQREAENAIRATEATDLAARAAAEALIADARKAEVLATRAENTTAKISNMGGRAVSLRTVWTHEITDAWEFAAYVWSNHQPDLMQFLNVIAKRLVDGGFRSLPGVKVNEGSTAQ